MGCWKNCSRTLFGPLPPRYVLIFCISFEFHFNPFYSYYLRGALVKMGWINPKDNLSKLRYLCSQHWLQWKNGFKLYCFNNCIVLDRHHCHRTFSFLSIFAFVIFVSFEHFSLTGKVSLICVVNFMVSKNLITGQGLY